MGPNLSHVTSFPRVPHLLIAENNFSTFESLMDVLGDRRIDVDFDVCTSHDGAMRKLFSSPYQLILSDVHLAEMDEFSLLKRSQALDTFVPFVVSATAREKDAVRRALAQGAFDVITIPLEPEQTVNTIRLALWESKLTTLVACKERALEKYREHMTAYPWGNEMDETFRITLSALEDSIRTYERSMLRIEESTVCFSDFATKVECYARTKALERLDGLGK